MAQSLAAPDDREAEQWPDGVIPGEGWFGWSIVCQYSQYEDGTRDIPDVESFIYSDETNERVEAQRYYRKVLGDQGSQKLLDLRARIATVLREHRIEVLDEAVLDLPLPGFKADQEIFQKKTSVRARCVLFSWHLMGEGTAVFTRDFRRDWTSAAQRSPESTPPPACLGCEQESTR